MRICFIPIDNRPVCYNLAKEICAINEDIELLIPPREFLGDLIKTADIEGLFGWLKELPSCDSVILSLDTLTYGGLIPSRRSEEDFEIIKARALKLKTLLEKNGAKIYAFSSIMRISDNNYNEEEKEYWFEYGKKIFEYSYNFHKNSRIADSELTSANTLLSYEIPEDILNDYLNTRKRNFEINKMYLDWQKEGFFEVLIFSKDDCAEYGLNVMEAEELSQMGACTKTGADEIPLSLLSRAMGGDFKVFVKFTEPEYKDCISNYEDISIEKSVFSQLSLCGFKPAQNAEDADLILTVNNFREKQGELVMGWDTEPYGGKFIPEKGKFYAAADVRFANGADNAFAEQVLESLDLDSFCGYSGWNTSANTLGSLFSGIKSKLTAKKYNKNAFKHLEAVRFLDDWGYQANVRAKISEPSDISRMMLPYEERVFRALGYDCGGVKYSFPWNRKFEVEVEIED